MNGGLAKFGRYLLAGASAIGLLAFGLPEAKAQNMQEIQAQINQMQATIKALQKQVEDAKRFPSTADAPLFPGFTGDEDTTFAARAGWAPINRETNGVLQVLHIGGSYRFREAGDDQPYFQYGPNAKGADLHMANAPINTGRIGEEDRFWGL
jgi:hypothetical protein